MTHPTQDVGVVLGSGTMTEPADNDVPLRGVVTIEWVDSASGWGKPPNVDWSLSSDPVLDRLRMRLLIASVLDFLEQPEPE